MAETPDRRLEAATDYLRSLPLEERAGALSAWDKAEVLALLDDNATYTCPHGQPWACSECGCPRGVAGCDGTECSWQCPEDGCQNSHEAFCYLCGGGRPDPDEEL